MTYDELVRKFNDDDKFVRYVAKRFLVPFSLDEIALAEGLPPGIFHKLFVDFPEFEQQFHDKVAEEDENAKELFLRQATTNALRKLASIIDTPTEIDNKDMIQACKAVLTYHPSNKKTVPPGPLDSIFNDLVNGGDGQ